MSEDEEEVGGEGVDEGFLERVPSVEEKIEVSVRS